MSRREALGFTLVELLVIITIIAILLSLMAPTFQRAILQARADQCASNVHQIGTASQSYAVANHGFLLRDIWPVSSGTQIGHYVFAARYLPHMGYAPLPPGPDTDSDYNAVYNALAQAPVFRCPALAGAADASGVPYVLNYCISGFSFARYQKGQGYQSGNPVRISQISGVSLSGAMYLCEFNPSYPGQTAKGFGTYDVWVPGHMPFHGSAPNASPRMIHAEDRRHEGRTTVAFFDGHAEGRPLTPNGVPVSLLNPMDTSHDP